MNIRYRQLGLSMVELLVALAISSFLILGITQIYIDNKKSYFFQQGQSENNESVRFLNYMLDREFQKIGYRREPDIDRKFVFKADSEKGFLIAGQTVKPLSDTHIKFRYQYSTDEDFSCDGKRYTDEPDSIEKDKINTLYENGSTGFRTVEIEFDKINNMITCNGNEIVSGVADFQLTYAIPVAQGDYSQGIKYVKFDDLKSSDKIKGIRYQALLASTMKALADFEGSASVDALYKDDDENKPSDKALYQFVNKTVMLRNLMSW